MKMYKAILDILVKKGTATIPVICKEMSEQATSYFRKDEQVVEQAYIKSLISKNKELFSLKDGIVSIRPEREPVMLSVVLYGYPGPERRLKVDFKKNRFTYFEWYLDSKARGSFNAPVPGSVEYFKQQLYSFNCWEWQDDYQAEGIIVDGTTWSVKLETRGEKFDSGGIDCFPKEWKDFCRAISTLIGREFLC
ncbi:MAG: hypothetical protein WB217_11415 [Mesobacillus sp.]|uniref:hypothetical protein n=1 Tax=Mesobacillus sp. TaxID=2675271 RepID=UPI003C621356